MTNDNQRAMINRIVYNLMDTLSDGEKVTKKFKKLYEGGQGAKNVDKKILEVGNTGYLGLPNLEKNVLDEDGNLRPEFKKEETFKTTFTVEKEVTVIEDGKEVTNLVPEEVTKSQTEVVPDNEAMAETTNRATALTYAYALFTELNKIQDELDDKTQKISNLESKVSNLENEIKSLKSIIQTLTKN